MLVPMSITLLTLIKILPFVAVIGYEYVGGDYSGKFNSIFSEHFRGNQDFIQESIDQILNDELDSVSDSDTKRIGNEIYSSLSLDTKKLEENISPFVIFVSDWTRIKTSVFATTVSALTVIAVQIMTIEPVQDSQLPTERIDILVILLSILIIILLIIDRWVDRLFRNTSPFHYNKEYSLRDLPRIAFNIIWPGRKANHYFPPRPIIVAVNLIAICAVVLSDLF